MPSSSRPCPHYLALSDTIDASKSPQIPPAVVESNRPPTDLEVLCIQRVINEVRARKTRLDARIAALQSALNQLIADRDALEEEIRMHQGTLSPLRRMPTELLSLIFGFLSRFKLRERQNPAPWTVSQVCYRWREIVSSQPSFWTRIDLDLGNLNNRSLKTPTQTSFGLVTQLRWSGKEPLDVVFTSYRPYVYTDKECALLKILAGHSARWEKLRISGSPAALSSSLAPIRCRLPLLRTLNVSSTPLRNEPWQLRTLDVFEIAPNLRHASVNKGGWGDPMHVILPFPGLVQYAAYSSWDGHLSVLRSMSFLVECALNIKDISTPPATTIPLPHLLRLSLSKPDFLECLDTPNLQDLYCSSRSDHLSSPFSRRPYRLQKLVLSFPASIADVTSILRAVPTVTDFGLEIPVGSMDGLCSALTLRNVLSDIGPALRTIVISFAASSRGFPSYNGDLLAEMVKSRALAGARLRSITVPDGVHLWRLKNLASEYEGLNVTFSLRDNEHLKMIPNHLRLDHQVDY